MSSKLKLFTCALVIFSMVRLPLAQADLRIGQYSIPQDVTQEDRSLLGEFLSGAVNWTAEKVSRDLQLVENLFRYDGTLESLPLEDRLVHLQTTLDVIDEALFFGAFFPEGISAPTQVGIALSVELVGGALVIAGANRALDRIKPVDRATFERTAQQTEVDYRRLINQSEQLKSRMEGLKAALKLANYGNKLAAETLGDYVEMNATQFAYEDLSRESSLESLRSGIEERTRALADKLREIGFLKAAAGADEIPHAISRVQRELLSIPDLPETIKTSGNSMLLQALLEDRTIQILRVLAQNVNLTLSEARSQLYSKQLKLLAALEKLYPNQELIRVKNDLFKEYSYVSETALKEIQARAELAEAQVLKIDQTMKRIRKKADKFYDFVKLSQRSFRPTALYPLKVQGFKLTRLFGNAALIGAAFLIGGERAYVWYTVDRQEIMAQREEIIAELERLQPRQAELEGQQSGRAERGERLQPEQVQSVGEPTNDEMKSI